jgi:hypothetical protein
LFKTMFPIRPVQGVYKEEFSWESAVVCNIGQGKARLRGYKRLKLGGGQAYDHSIA